MARKVRIVLHPKLVPSRAFQDASGMWFGVALEEIAMVQEMLHELGLLNKEECGRLARGGSVEADGSIALELIDSGIAYPHESAMHDWLLAKWDRDRRKNPQQGDAMPDIIFRPYRRNRIAVFDWNSAKVRDFIMSTMGSHPPIRNAGFHGDRYPVYTPLTARKLANKARRKGLKVQVI